MAATSQKLIEMGTKIVAVGRNYAAHAKELCNAVPKAAGLPWTIAKGQDTFTPISSMLPKSAIPDPDNLELWLKVDRETRQKGLTKDMMFKVPFLISHISSFMTLLEGDVVLTGTPPDVHFNV